MLIMFCEKFQHLFVITTQNHGSVGRRISYPGGNLRISNIKSSERMFDEKVAFKSFLLNGLGNMREKRSETAVSPLA